MKRRSWNRNFEYSGSSLPRRRKRAGMIWSVSQLAISIGTPTEAKVESFPSQFSSMSLRTSVKCPVTDAAAAIAGLTKWVRLPRPLTPREIAVTGRGRALAGLQHVAVHGDAHRATGLPPFIPASTKILSRPSASACFFTMPEPGDQGPHLRLPSPWRLPPPRACLQSGCLYRPRQRSYRL